LTEHSDAVITITKITLNNFGQPNVDYHLSSATVGNQPVTALKSGGTKFYSGKFTATDEGRQAFWIDRFEISADMKGKYAHLDLSEATSDNWGFNLAFSKLNPDFNSEQEEGEGIVATTWGLNGYANGMGEANTAFSENIDNYANYLIVEVTDETLALGLRKTTPSVYGDWCCFDNFRLFKIPTLGSSIQTPRVDVINPDTQIYNLLGCVVGKAGDVSKLNPGIYIMGHKKIIIHK
jgi:hypothetical protein